MTSGRNNILLVILIFAKRVLACTNQVEPVCGGITSEATFYDDSDNICYVMVNTSEELRSWSGAMSRCSQYASGQGLTGHLAWFTSQSKYNAVKAGLPSAVAQAWVGLKKKHSKAARAELYWYSNETTASLPATWGPGSLGYAQTIDTKTCLRANNWPTDNSFINTKCSIAMPYLCQMGCGSSHTPAYQPTSCTDHCEAVNGLMRGESCYILEKQARSFNSADDVCQALGGDGIPGTNGRLAHIPDFATFNAIKAEFNTPDQYWVGLKDTIGNNNFGDYAWISGVCPSEDSRLSTVFASNVDFGETNERCARLQLSADAFKDMDCDTTTYAFLCELKVCDATMCIGTTTSTTATTTSTMEPTTTTTQMTTTTTPPETTTSTTMEPTTTTSEPTTVATTILEPTTTTTPEATTTTMPTTTPDTTTTSETITSTTIGPTTTTSESTTVATTILEPTMTTMPTTTPDTTTTSETTTSSTIEPTTTISESTTVATTTLEPTTTTTPEATTTIMTTTTPDTTITTTTPGTTTSVSLEPTTRSESTSVTTYTLEPTTTLDTTTTTTTSSTIPGSTTSTVLEPTTSTTSEATTATSTTPNPTTITPEVTTTNPKLTTATSASESSGSSRCPVLLVENGHLENMDSFNDHTSTKSLVCQSGYIPQGSPTVCNNGQWSSIPSCKSTANWRCPSAKQSIYTGPACYWVSSSGSTWNDAFATCAAEDGLFAPISSSDLWNERLLDFIQTSGLTLFWFNVKYESDLDPILYDQSGTALMSTPYMPYQSTLSNGLAGCKTIDVASKQLVHVSCTVSLKSLCYRPTAYAQFQFIKNQLLVAGGNQTKLGETTTSSVRNCVVKCRGDVNCLATNYNRETMVCELYSQKPSDGESVATESHDGSVIGVRMY